MDTSKEYVVMRIKAEDDLGWGQTAIGLHRVIIYENDEYIICSDENANFFVLHSKYGLFQLERQDQLQEIYAKHIGADGYCALIDFSKWFKEIVELDNLGSDKRIYDTPEQLWLAFVMYERFGKIWDGKEWIKKND